MKIEFLQEPELEFGDSQRHIDIKFGIREHGTLDYNKNAGCRRIRVGFIGTNETIEGMSNWLVKCRDVIPAKPSKQPKLFAEFPGFNEDIGFYSHLEWESTLYRNILNPKFAQLKGKSRNVIITEAANLFAQEIDDLTGKSNADVIICAPPMILLEYMNPSESSNKQFGEPKLDFHHLLKALAMKSKKPIQIVLPATYDESKRRKQKKHVERELTQQDEATRAWNIHTAIYYKASGYPWRLVRDPSEFASCYIGISFFKTLDRSKMHTSAAQVFNERGEGVIVRGGAASISKDDNQAHLNKEGAYQLLKIALARYKNEHFHFPARVVLHKSSSYDVEETEGFLQAIDEHNIDLYDFINLDRSFTRLFRHGLYPPLRGTLLYLEDRSLRLYARGSVVFFETYTGYYPPTTLQINCQHGETNPRDIAEEILALTKMNWNNTQFDGLYPITLRAAKQVGQILKYLSDTPDFNIMPYYRFYM